MASSNISSSQIKTLCSAIANGDVQFVKQQLNSNQIDLNSRSPDGMTPLCLAAFWGYAEIVQSLLEHGADVNSCNKGTLWTPLHCAAFQGHGKVLMKLMEYKPNITLKDNQNRTASDFASALDAVWSIFAAAGCKRTPKFELIKLDIVKKTTYFEDPTLPQQQEYAHFSRPGSAYIVQSQSMYENGYNSKQATAHANGDVLAGIDEESKDQRNYSIPSMHIWK
ncbi:uncharacterized protein LOC141906673 [Tubulanus polymorphus]|uniref:uncharacterized protein LOC141906673 n=1 Tax=Tubulanus polymorphus TaxID=672921 RepID=UPI003DA67EF6